MSEPIDSMLILYSPPKEDMDPSPSGNDARVGITDGVLPENSHENLADLIIGVTSALLAVTTIFVALRIYVRAFFIKKWRADDTMLVCSFFAVVFHDTMICLGESSRMLAARYLDTPYQAADYTKQQARDSVLGSTFG